VVALPGCEPRLIVSINKGLLPAQPLKRLDNSATNALAKKPDWKRAGKTGERNMRILALGCAAVLLAGCAVTTRVEDVGDTQTKIVGLSEERLLACMGAPANKAIEGNKEVWSYNSDYVTSEQSSRHFCKLELVTFFGPSCVDWLSPPTRPPVLACTAKIVMNNSRVTQVNYVGPTGEPLTHGEQCGSAVENCLR
jgi:hypothetical protein